jgi:hypothetical protein
MRKSLIAVMALLVIVVIAGATVVYGLLARGGTSGAAAVAGKPVPASAAAAAKRLVSGIEADQRAALSPGLAAVLPAGAVFPPGSMLDLDSGSWRQSGNYANATGTLSEPGGGTQPVEIGFIRSGGDWLVTFEERRS